jgi:hypothetical protein
MAGQMPPVKGPGKINRQRQGMGHNCPYPTRYAVSRKDMKTLG